MFDYKWIKDELLSVVTAMANMLERNWPHNYSSIDSARIFFVATVRIAINTFKTIIYLCADTQEDYRRDRKFSLSVPPLNRTILENVMTALFVLEDIPQRIPWFYKSGYREWKEALIRYKRDYGQYPEWKDFIDTLEQYVDKQLPLIGLTQDEINETEKKIHYWPNPGKMATLSKQANPQSATGDFLSFLNDWFYKALSGQSHLNAHGLVQRGMFFTELDIMVRAFGDKADKIIEQELERFRNDQIWISIILILALASEIELHFGFGLDQRLKYIWGLIVNYNDQAKDLYERRYKNPKGV